MAYKAKRIGQTANYMGQFFVDVADSVRRAHEARELMHRPESHFKRLGTTRDSEIRRVFEI